MVARSISSEEEDIVERFVPARCMSFSSICTLCASFGKLQRLSGSCIDNRQKWVGNYELAYTDLLYVGSFLIGPSQCDSIPSERGGRVGENIAALQRFKMSQIGKSWRGGSACDS